LSPNSIKIVKKQQQQQQQRNPTSQQESANKMQVYMCSFCGFQSKELGHVRFRFHMRTTHMNNKEPKIPIVNQAVANALTPNTVCSESSIS